LASADEFRRRFLVSLSPTSSVSVAELESSEFSSFSADELDTARLAAASIQFCLSPVAFVNSVL
jgi:hypothetical protein